MSISFTAVYLHHSLHKLDQLIIIKNCIISVITQTATITSGQIISIIIIIIIIIIIGNLLVVYLINYGDKTIKK